MYNHQRKTQKTKIFLYIHDVFQFDIFVSEVWDSDFSCRLQLSVHFIENTQNSRLPWTAGWQTAAGNEHPDPEDPLAASPSEGWQRIHISTGREKDKINLSKKRQDRQVTIIA